MISAEKKDGHMVVYLEGDGGDVMEEMGHILVEVVAQCEQATPGSRRKVPRIMARWLRSREFQNDVDTVMKWGVKADADKNAG